MNMCIDHNDGDPIYHYESVPVETQAGLYNSKGDRLGILPTNVNTVPGGGHEIGNQFGDEILSGDFTHFYTRTIGGVFFEVVQRRGSYEGYGAPNAGVRLAAQHRHDLRATDVSGY